MFNQNAFDYIARVIQEVRDYPLMLYELPGGEPDGRAFAIDGGSINLFDGGAFRLGAVRAGFGLYYDGACREEDTINGLEVVLLGVRPGEYTRRYKRVFGVDPSGAEPGVGGELEAIRSVMEWAAARAAVEKAREGDVVLIDGMLVSPGAGIAPAQWIEELFAAAARRGVFLVGVSKSSGALLGRMPLLAAFMLKADWEAPGKACYAQINDDQAVVRFLPGCRYGFLVQKPLSDDRPIEEYLRKLEPLAAYAPLPGYPYPLAEQHRRVAIRQDEARMAARKALREAQRNGLSPTVWGYLFASFHEELEGRPGYGV